MIDLTKCDRIVAEERQEDILHLGVAILAAFTFVPIHVPDKAEIFKYRVRPGHYSYSRLFALIPRFYLNLKMSSFLAKKLLENSNSTFTENWLVFLRHPTSCNNVLKALYSFCVANVDMCMLISKNPCHMNALYDILAGKVNINHDNSNF